MFGTCFFMFHSLTVSIITKEQNKKQGKLFTCLGVDAFFLKLEISAQKFLDVVKKTERTFTVVQKFFFVFSLSLNKKCLFFSFRKTFVQKKILRASKRVFSSL